MGKVFPEDFAKAHNIATDSSWRSPADRDFAEISSLVNLIIFKEKSTSEIINLSSNLFFLCNSLKHSVISVPKDPKCLLIKFSLQMTRLINNNAYSYIGSIIISLFASYIKNNINIEKWMFEVIDLIKNTDKIENILKEILDEEKIEKDEYVNSLVNYRENKNIFITNIEKYIKFRFDEDNNFIIKNIEFMKFSDLRIVYYFNNFSDKNYLPYFYPGSTIFDTIIISYDCLLECRDNFELLVIYTILFIGDSHSTGGLSLSLFGLMYGKKNIPKHLYKNNFEMKNKINELINKIKK